MKNWIVVLLIFIAPLTLYAYFEARANSDAMCKIEGTKEVKNPQIKIIKFSSPMCSECKEVEIELNNALKDYKDSVIVEEINVIDNSKNSKKYNKMAIKKFNVTLVPTLVFIDRDGKIIKRQEGLMKEFEIKETLNGAK